MKTNCWVNVESSNIKRIYYDPAQLLLKIEFHNGGMYKYYPITYNIFQNLCSADSIGKFFSANIRNNKDIVFEKLDI